MPNSNNYCTSCIVIRYFKNITDRKRNFDTCSLRNNQVQYIDRKFGIASLGFNFNQFQMALILILSLLLSHGEAGILRGHRNRADRGGLTVTNTRHYQGSAGDPGSYCGPCDTRNCPLVSAETCQGQVVKDRCGCCPFCDTLKPATSLVSTENNTTASK